MDPGVVKVVRGSQSPDNDQTTAFFIVKNEKTEVKTFLLKRRNYVYNQLENKSNLAAATRRANRFTEMRFCDTGWHLSY